MLKQRLNRSYLTPAPGVWVLDPNRTYFHFSVYKPHLYPENSNLTIHQTRPSFNGLQHYYKFKLVFCSNFNSCRVEKQA